jgi:hypothetical protein
MKCINTLYGGKIRVKGKGVPVLKQALRHEDVWGSGRIDPGFLDLGTRLK